MEPLLAHSEREWILIGMAECCAAKGFEATGVADVCAAAGVSRQSFEKAFAGTEECLGALMGLIVEEAWRRLDAVRSPGGAWGASLREGVAALLGLAAERPAFARVALLEAPAAGGRAGALYASSRAALLAAVEKGREQGEASVPASAARGALAGVEVLVVAKVLAGEAERLGEFAPDITYLLTVPYLGQDAALRAAGTTGRGRHLRAVA
jgi:AcrR family transcriptional regulator